MVSFLSLVAEHVRDHYEGSTQRLCIVLPGRRASIFLKKELTALLRRPFWVPAIVSAEDVIGEISGLTVLDDTDLTCHLYESYRACLGELSEPFEGFVRWGQLMLQDFNEVDRYLVPADQLYSNLRHVKEIENWSLGEEHLTPHQEEYLKFMASIGAIYARFSAFLLQNNWAYPGLAYRVAAEKVSTSPFADKYTSFLFCGFNALTASERTIMLSLQKKGKAAFLWDVDEYYLRDKQEAGMFMRKNLAEFGKGPLGTHRLLAEPKSVRVVSVPKQVGQGQVVRQEVERLLADNVRPDAIAVVLANEKLLWPVVKQLPASLTAINITMEYPFRYSATYALFEQLLGIHTSFSQQQKKNKTVYHKDLVSLLRNALFARWLRAASPGRSVSSICAEISRRNISFISPSLLSELLGGRIDILEPAENSIGLNDKLCRFADELIDRLRQTADSMELEFIFHLRKHLNRTSDLIAKYPYFEKVTAFRHLFSQVTASTSVPFLGEPLAGIQVMGVLETRALDFEHVIFVNVNEGVLPSGKSINSFIPNDLKQVFGMPLYVEKDAVYAYHFFRLMQRCSSVAITYDSETDTFGKGEKSRFVTQLLLEAVRELPAIQVEETVASYASIPRATDNSINISKSPAALSRIINKAASDDKFGGLSPSSLIMFKECGLKFYFRYGGGLKEPDTVEESAETGTFGTILHLALETLYRPLVGQNLKPSGLREQQSRAGTVVEECFASHFGTEAAGKRLLQQDVIKVYVDRILNNDAETAGRLADDKKSMHLVSVEHPLSASLETGSDPPLIYIRGNADRIDLVDGTLRIIDYKSSVKDTDKFAYESVDVLFEDKRYNKQLQLFTYAWLAVKSGLASAGNTTACIIPFKSFSEEPKSVVGLDGRPLRFTSGLLQEFEDRLSGFVRKIFDRSESFSQTNDADTHRYCPYNAICNFR